MSYAIRRNAITGGSYTYLREIGPDDGFFKETNSLEDALLFEDMNAMILALRCSNVTERDRRLIRRIDPFKWEVVEVGVEVPEPTPERYIRRIV